MISYTLTYEDIIKINLWCQKIVSSDIDVTDGIRDYNLLKSIPISIYQSFAGEELYPTIYDKCSTIWFALSKYHCFVDGNKRTALVTAIVYLKLNSYNMMPDNKHLYDISISIASGRMQLEDIKMYLTKHTFISTGTADISDILKGLSEKKKFISILRELGK